jgi:hypothetical protein
MTGTIFDAVQAALLNSECSPKYAVERALLAVLQFAHTEASMGLDEFEDLALKLRVNNDLDDPELGRKT